MGLSVGIITKNEEKIIKKTLEAVEKIADEIVIVDSHSTDRTLEIANNFGSKIIKQDWLGYGGQKNKVIENCSNDWILLLDADEIITDSLIKEIESIIVQKTNKVYAIKMRTVAFSKEIKFGGWSSSYRIRLFQKKSGKYNEDRVHEKFETSEKVFKLKNHINHYSYFNLEDYINKMNIYTSNAAKDIVEKNKKITIGKIIFKPIFSFLKMYIFRLGFLDGIEGLLLALMSSIYTLSKYFKALELKRGIK